jgi:hypothetical protein
MLGGVRWRSRLPWIDARASVEQLLLDPVVLADEIESYALRHAERLNDDDAHRAEHDYADLAARIRSLARVAAWPRAPLAAGPPLSSGPGDARGTSLFESGSPTDPLRQARALASSLAGEFPCARATMSHRQDECGIDWVWAVRGQWESGWPGSLP